MIYVVQPGDTLLGVARRYGMPTQDVARLNQLAAPDRLVPGQALLLTDYPRGPWQGISCGYVYPNISRWLLGDCLQQLNTLSVFSYGFRPDGTLLPPRRPAAWLVREAAEEQAASALVLTPFGSDGRFDNTLIAALLAAPAARQRLLQQIGEEMTAQGFTELNLDFEFVRREDRESYVSFVEQAKRCLPGLVTVCLAPKVRREQPGLLYEGKDYRGLGAAADRVMLMTYEWGYTFGPPMAVAPLDQVRRVTEYALTEIPPEKILLGLANYGYDWQLPYVSGRTAARSLGNVEAVELAAEQGAVIQYDEKAQSPWFTYDSGGSTHEVWFEDVRSWGKKLELVRKYALAGVGIWQLMRPFRAGMTLVGTYLRAQEDEEETM